MFFRYFLFRLRSLELPKNLDNSLVHWTTSPSCLAADLSVLLAPTVWQCRRLSWQPSPTNRAFPVVSPRTWNHLLDDVTSAEYFGYLCYPPSVTCLPNPFSDYSLDWTSPNLSLVNLAVVCIISATLEIPDWLIYWLIASTHYAYPWRDGQAELDPAGRYRVVMST